MTHHCLPSKLNIPQSEFLVINQSQALRQDFKFRHSTVLKLEQPVAMHIVEVTIKYKLKEANIGRSEGIANQEEHQGL